MHDQSSSSRLLYGTALNGDSDHDDDTSGRSSSMVNSHNTTFLCQRCHIEERRGCPRHGTQKMIASHERRLKLAVPAPAVLVIPGREDNMHKCLCCGEKHSLVVSYLRPHLKDLHMRPVMVKTQSGKGGWGWGSEGDGEGGGCWLLGVFGTCGHI